MDADLQVQALVLALGAEIARRLAHADRGGDGAIYQVKALKRLVDEIERVSSVGERPLGLGREQGIGQYSLRGTGCNCREQGALGRLAVAHACPAPQPSLEHGRLWPAAKRRTFPARRLPV